MDADLMATSLSTIQGYHSIISWTKGYLVGRMALSKEDHNEALKVITDGCTEIEDFNKPTSKQKDKS